MRGDADVSCKRDGRGRRLLVGEVQTPLSCRVSATTRLFNLYDLTRPELGALVTSWDLSPVHATRLWKYLYYDQVATLEEMTELPARLCTRLVDGWMLGHLGVAH